MLQDLLMHQVPKASDPKIVLRTVPATSQSQRSQWKTFASTLGLPQIKFPRLRSQKIFLRSHKIALRTAPATSQSQSSQWKTFASTLGLPQIKFPRLRSQKIFLRTAPATSQSQSSQWNLLPRWACHKSSSQGLGPKKFSLELRLPHPNPKVHSEKRLLQRWACHKSNSQGLGPKNCP